MCDQYVAVLSALLAYNGMRVRLRSVDSGDELQAVWYTVWEGNADWRDYSGSDKVVTKQQRCKAQLRVRFGEEVAMLQVWRGAS